jgi:hypothetical protein
MRERMHASQWSCVIKTTRRRRYLLALALAAVAGTAPAALGRSVLSCDQAHHQYAVITAQVKKAAAKVDQDGSGQVSVVTFLQDERHLQHLKARQRVAVQALASCKR